MSGRTYERLKIEDFGQHLLETNDLDPIYVALHKLEGEWTQAKIHRWLVAYWCLYHAGAACYLAGLNSKDFWAGLMKAAANSEPAPTGGRWPRGHERRHFRGAQGIDAIAELMTKYDHPHQMVKYVAGNGGHYTDVAKRTQEHRGFGPWMSFKVADMVDRVLGIPVDFSESAVFMFTDPTKAALMLFSQRAGLPASSKIKDEGAAVHQVVEHLTWYFRNHKAPPLGDRPVGLQEVETILCKWKSHMNGHYPLYNDIDEIRQGLESWNSTSKLVGQFLQAMPARK